MRYDVCGIDCCHFYDLFESTGSYEAACEAATAYAYDYETGGSCVYIHDNVENMDIFQW